MTTNFRHRGYGIAFLITLLTITYTAWAEEKIGSYGDTAELSYVQTNGNTDILTFSGNNTLKHQFSDRWSGLWKIGALYGKTDGDKTAERYYTDLRTDYKASERVYYIARTGWFQDKFAGIDNRYYLGPGVGYRILIGERHFLSTEVGLNYAREMYSDGITSDFLEGRAFGKYEYVFNPKTKFSQVAEYLQNFDSIDQFHINTVTALTTTLTNRFSLKIAYEINYNNQPTPDTIEKTDSIFSVALVANL